VKQLEIININDINTENFYYEINDLITIEHTYELKNKFDTILIKKNNLKNDTLLQQQSSKLYDNIELYDKRKEKKLVMDIVEGKKQRIIYEKFNREETVKENIEFLRTFVIVWLIILLRVLKILCQSDIINIIRIDRDERYKSTI